MSLFSILLALLSAALHAGWNLLVRDRRPTDMFLWMSVVLIVTATLPTLLWEWIAPPVVSVVWQNLLLGAAFLAGFYLGMARSYGHGDFTVAYPLARALPVLLVAIAEWATATPPTWLGWSGILLIAIGSAVLPLQSLHELTLARYWNRATAWILFAALMIAGYTLVDSAALRQLPQGLSYAIRYAILESVIGGILYWLLLRALRETIEPPRGPVGWGLAALAIFFVLGSYALILWAFQSGDPASYIIGLRQISIVIGVVAGAYFFRERGARLRIPAALTITMGVFLLSVA